MKRPFLLSLHLGRSVVYLNETGEGEYQCSKCAGDIQQTAPNPYVWYCSKCNAEYTGPLMEKGDEAQWRR